MGAAYGPGWLRRARCDLRADRGEIENPDNPALAHTGYATEQPAARLPVAVSRQLVWSDCGEDWLRGRRRFLFPPEWSLASRLPAEAKS